MKRWLVIVFAGELLLALAGALLLRQVYREYDFSGPGQSFLYVLTLQFMPYWMRGAARRRRSALGCSSTGRGVPFES